VSDMCSFLYTNIGLDRCVLCPDYKTSPRLAAPVPHPYPRFLPLRAAPPGSRHGDRHRVARQRGQGILLLPLPPPPPPHPPHPPGRIRPRMIFVCSGWFVRIWGTSPRLFHPRTQQTFLIFLRVTLIYRCFISCAQSIFSISFCRVMIRV